MSLKELTKERHEEVENCEFNVRMMQGNLTKNEYLQYLFQLYMLFEILDDYASLLLPHHVQGDIQRRYRILEDIKTLRTNTTTLTVTSSTNNYYLYLDTLSSEYDDAKMAAHIYLNYMMILNNANKVNIPFSKELYNFFDKNDEITHSVLSIEPQASDSEVNVGYDYYIEIFKELQDLQYRN